MNLLTLLAEFLQANYATLSFLLVYGSVYLATATVSLVIKQVYYTKSGVAVEMYLFLAVLLSGVPLTMYFDPNFALFSLCFLGHLTLLALAVYVFENHSLLGLNFYIANFFTIAIGLVWGAWFLLTLPVSLTTKLLLSATTPLLFVALPSGLLQLIEQYEVVCRKRWRHLRKIAPWPREHDAHAPFVSIHVPTYSEPPEIVIETLSRIARFDYPNYEVIVIDNNTEDLALWKPVETYCSHLGPHFRFMHVDKLAGAKGGALNYALRHAAAEAELVSVVDADYHAKPDFLRDLVGYFSDTTLGFVQTPHDYRGWKDNLYLTMCYWEYKLFFHTTMVSLSEHKAGLTVGTMCIIRKDALLDAGGWSETCVTEDSELAIRIHNAGYSSIYVDSTYGKGLIPDTFTDFKKQRYRWTAGPVQEFRNHLPLYLGLSGTQSKLGFRQKLFHINHGLTNVLIGIALPFTAISMLTIISMIMHREIVPVPFELWLTATILLASNPLLNWMMFRVRLKAGLKEMLALMFANRALNHVVTYAALRTLLTGNAKWTRTSKFKSDYSYTSAIFNTKEELFAGVGIFLFIAVAFALFPHTGLSLMFMIGMSYMALSYLAAPLFSIINIHSMRKEAGAPTADLRTAETMPFTASALR